MILNKIRELLLFPSYFYHKKLIKKSYNWNKKKITNYQKQNILPLIKKFGSIETNKNYYKYNSKQFDKCCFKILVRKTKTGGTTSSPLIFYEDIFFTRQKELAYLFDIWSKIGYKPFDLRVRLRNPVDDNLIKYDFILNRWTISLNLLSKKKINELKIFLGKLNFFYLETYPSSLHTFIKILGEDFFKSLKIKGILAGSEAFPINQIKSFKKKYKIPVSHWYGHAERFSLSFFCNDCEMFHFYPTYGFTKFKLWKKKIYKICGYSYKKIGTRFINYDTEDLAIQSKPKCKIKFLTAKKILGRNKELFYDKNGFEHNINNLISNLKTNFWSNIIDFQFVQKTKGKLLVRLQIKDKSKYTLVKKILIQRMGKIIKLNFQIVDNLYLSKLGKRPYLIKLIN